jgi:hypothetical protein
MIEDRNSWADQGGHLIVLDRIREGRLRISNNPAFGWNGLQEIQEFSE